MNRHQKLLLGTGLAAFLLAATAGFLYYLLAAPAFHPKQTTYIYIDSNDTADSVYHKLSLTGQPATLKGIRLLSALKKYNQHLHTGKYAIRPNDNSWQLFLRLYRGHQTPVNLTIGSVRTLDRLARQIGQQLMMDSTAIASLLQDTLLQREMGYTQATLPCLFVPNTYQVYWDMHPRRLMERLRREHQRFWETRAKLAADMGLTPTEVCTLASIVDEETNYGPEKPTIAGLYLNRLRRGMPLQADPTVKFALQDFSLRRISNEHLLTASPYNTYAQPGLPPGPIRIASAQGIDAVLHYEHHNYLYMCAKEDFSGSHRFAATYQEHQSNARRYHRALNERRIYK